MIWTYHKIHMSLRGGRKSESPGHAALAVAKVVNLLCLLAFKYKTGSSRQQIQVCGHFSGWDALARVWQDCLISPESSDD